MMEKKKLVPRKVVNSEGKISYSESLQAWNTIRLKKEIIKEFPHLSEKRSKFSYQILFYRDIKEFENMLKNLKKEESMPLLLWLYKEEVY